MKNRRLLAAQEGVLHIVFRIADDKGLLFTDLKDLKAVLKRGLLGTFFKK
ncbi:MAG: DUF853 family protein [Lachnospiraceae bacterium]|jgi:hypothetical protein|nr:DUF853 family protein [Lachnospiraceae bacterium]